MPFAILPMIGFSTIRAGELCLVLLNFRSALWIRTMELENDRCDQMRLDSNDIRFYGI